MRRISRRLIGVFIVLIFPYTLFAQVMGIEDAVNAALSNYPSLSAAQSALEALRVNAQLIKDNRLPNVRLHDQINVGTANGLSGSYFSMGLIVPTSGGRRPENSSDLASGNIALATADWEVYNFGRFQAEDRLARADILVGEAAVENEKFGIRQTVINTYLELLWLRQTLKIEERNIARVDTARRIIGNLVNNGIRPGLDSSLASVEFSRAKLNYFQMQEELQRAFIQLATLTARPVNALEIDTSFQQQALLMQPIEIKLTADHPLLRYRTNLVNRQTSEIELIRKSALPRVSLLTSAWARGTSLDIDNNFGPIGSGFGFSRTNFLVGIAATVNLMDFHRIKNRSQMQQWRVKQASSQLETQQFQLQNMLTTSDSVMATVRLALLELPTALNSAERAYQQRLSLYNNGLENILGLTDALQLLTTVEKQAVNIQRRAVNVRLHRAYATSNFEDFFSLFRRQ
ncbi:TolC family protein [Dyadobacter psychrotolerans]|uniref:TolC family protein n=1 Tax=Dyadobacter psychrotolerans TaxID=2541721 RepID=A0A4R5DF51_9BACT|nr:TolC family protein [Dyadobacter psychrotolerans]TDE08993.1 TolC family protein [Dyadobacter psychrotolerans]